MEIYNEKISNEEQITIDINNFVKLGIVTRKGNYFVFNFEKFVEEFPKLEEEFSQHPIKFLNTIKVFLKREFGIDKLRIINFGGEEDIANFRVEHIGKLFKVKGMISKTNKVVALVKESWWNCSKCKSSNKVINSSKKPEGCSCGNDKYFTLEKKIYLDVQEIDIEENQDKVVERQPQKIRIRLYDDLTDASLSNFLQPGNKVEIIGVVEEIAIIRKQITEELFEYRLKAIDVINLEEMIDDEVIEEEDEKQIVEISANNPLEVLANNIAPEIVGHLNVKKTLVLQQVGGVKKTLKDGKKTRDRIHILLIGDAGVSKTQLGMNVHLRTPKSYYTSGEQTSAAGLTAAAVRDELTGTWGLQAGAMPKANGSTLIADEIEKAKEGTLIALHTPLESGIIPISKAGINTTLRAECSLLALANPKGGRFDLYGKETLVKQINMPPTLLSRFDIIHIMKDKIDEKIDSDIVDSIFNNDSNCYDISVELYRKYIIHARKLKPKLKEECLVQLKEFYNKVRRQSVSKDSKMSGMPITPRHIQGIIRMAEANAKIRLSEWVEIEDFDVAEELFYDSLLKIGMDEDGTIDFARMEGGITLSRKKKIEVFSNVLNILFENKDVLTDGEIKEELFKRNVNMVDYYETLQDLNKEGYIIKNSDGWRKV